MGADFAGRRRWVGGMALLAAVGMLVGGETLLKGHLSDLGFLAYWLICLGLTGVAILIAFLDARVLRRRTRQEQRELFEATLKKVVTDAERKPRRASGAEAGKDGGKGERRSGRP